MLRPPRTRMNKRLCRDSRDRRCRRRRRRRLRRAVRPGDRPRRSRRAGRSARTAPPRPPHRRRSNVQQPQSSPRWPPLRDGGTECPTVVAAGRRIAAAARGKTQHARRYRHPPRCLRPLWAACQRLQTHPQQQRAMVGTQQSPQPQPHGVRDPRRRRCRYAYDYRRYHDRCDRTQWEKRRPPHRGSWHPRRKHPMIRTTTSMQPGCERDCHPPPRQRR
jgi:hypothetical protein